MILLLGCDPEVFVRKPSQKRFFSSAHGLVKGDKKNPLKCKDGALQVDGMALEFNIDPALDEDEFYDNVMSVLGQLKASVPDYEVVATPVAHFQKKVMEAQPDEAKLLGCEPDFNAWRDGAVNPRPNADVNFRTGAGHIHFGWCEGVDINSPAHREACNILIKALDSTLGIACTAFDTGAKRRQLYGSMGAYRPKPYGCEYRVPSNAWLCNEETIRWVYRVSTMVFDRLHHGVYQQVLDKHVIKEILSAKVIKPRHKRYIVFALERNNLPLPPNWR